MATKAPNPHAGHRERFKKEFLARPDSFPEHKVMELLLYYAVPRADTNALAHTLIDHFGSVAGVLDASPEELCKIKGMGNHATVLFTAIKETGRRYVAERTKMNERLLTTREAKELLLPNFFGATKEMVYVICMDGKRKVLGVRKVCEGNVNAVEVTTRLLAEVALSLNATTVILAHNHVAGIAFPSQEDIATTLHLRGILAHMNITLIDHLVVVDDDAVSLADSGMYSAE